MCRAGFEPAPPKRVDLKSNALDHSANDTDNTTFPCYKDIFLKEYLEMIFYK